MNSSENQNVTPINRRGSTSSLEPPSNQPMPPALKELLQHLEHVSAEINTAIREGFYVQMGVPLITYAPRVRSVNINVETGEVDVDADVDITEVRLQYEIQELDPARIKTVDHRDALSKRRNPDYQPPQGVS
jgi:hypothetical protein